MTTASLILAILAIVLAVSVAASFVLTQLSRQDFTIEGRRLIVHTTDDRSIAGVGFMHEHHVQLVAAEMFTAPDEDPVLLGEIVIERSAVAFYQIDQRTGT